MPERLPAEKTPCTSQEMFDALGYAWVQLFQEQPKKESLLCLLCQWALETGWGKSCYCWNIGNFKSRDGDGRDWCYYVCDEVLRSDVANNYIAKAGNRTDGSGPDAVFEYAAKNGSIAVKFYPDHPVARFRAYQTLEAGAIDYVSSLRNRFSKAWPAILAGDPDQFVHMLKVQGYFTADEESYRKTVHALFNQLSAKNFSMDDIPILSDAQKQQITDLVAITMSQSWDPATGDQTDEDA